MSEESKLTEKPDYGPNYIGNVIRILDKQTLLINVGSNVLKEGDKIKVYTVVEPIYDLSGEILCMYEYTKDTLEVIDVNKKYSICKKTRTKVVESPIASALTLSPLFGSSSELVPLDVQDDDISPFKKVDSKIQIGDPIKRV